LPGAPYTQERLEKFVFPHSHKRQVKRVVPQTTIRHTMDMVEGEKAVR
jgi:hypothetical protein